MNKRITKVTMQNGDTVIMHGPGKVPTLVARGMSRARPNKLSTKKLFASIACVALIALAVALFLIISNVVQHNGGPFTGALAAIVPMILALTVFTEEILEINTI